MNIRYRFRNRESGRIWEEIFSLEEIESVLWEDWKDEVEILSRDPGTGLKDFTLQNEIFHKDRVSASGCDPEDEREYTVLWRADYARFELFYIYENKEYWHCALAKDEVEALHLEIIAREE